MQLNILKFDMKKMKNKTKSIKMLKTVAFIAGKKNPAIQKIFIRFSIENLIANISLYALSWPKFWILPHL